MELTDRELAIMQALWRDGPMTAQQVRQALPNHPDNSTVRTFLRILEDKRHIAHRKRGRTFVYRARTSREQALRRGVDLLMDRFFDGSLAGLLEWAGAGGSPRRRRSGPSRRPRRSRPTRTADAGDLPVEDSRPQADLSEDDRDEEVWLL